MVEAIRVDNVAIDDDKFDRKEGEESGGKVVETPVVAEEVNLEKKKGLKGWIRLHKRLVLKILCLVIVVILVAIVLSVVGVDGGAPPTPEEVFLSEASPRVVELLSLLDQVTPREILVDPSTPQSKALWMADVGE